LMQVGGKHICVDLIGVSPLVWLARDWRSFTVGQSGETWVIVLWQSTYFYLICVRYFLLSSGAVPRFIDSNSVSHKSMNVDFQRIVCYPKRFNGAVCCPLTFSFMCKRSWIYIITKKNYFKKNLHHFIFTNIKECKPLILPNLKFNQLIYPLYVPFGLTYFWAHAKQIIKIKNLLCIIISLSS
jgi:hypothetical protein